MCFYRTFWELVSETYLKVKVWQQRPEKEGQCALIGCSDALSMKQIWSI